MDAANEIDENDRRKHDVVSRPAAKTSRSHMLKRLHLPRTLRGTLDKAITVRNKQCPAADFGRVDNDWLRLMG